jgi:hypothetical protein
MPRGLFGSGSQRRLDGGPFKVAEFVAHDSRLQFGRLNHVQGGTINQPSGAIAENPNALILLLLSEQNGHGWTLLLARPGRS